MRQGCVLPADGAHRAASKSTNSSASAIGSPDIARGDHRSRKTSSIGWSAVRRSLPLTITADQ